MIEFLSTNIGSFAALISVLATLTAIYKYIENYQRKNITKNYLLQLKELFEKTIAKLSSENESEKLSAAILLRRFFDEDSESGVNETPLADETINTIAAILRKEKTSDYQKLLADGLKFAPSLESSDLQKANLSNSVFGIKDLNLKFADFYKANLTNTSFKVRDFGKTKKDGSINEDGVNLEGAVFYQANLQNTNFSGANLEGVDFYDANLDNANFTGAKNIPNEIKNNLNDQNRYKISTQEKNNKVFISKPRTMTETQEMTYSYVISKLKNNYTLEELERIDDQNSSILPNIQNKINNNSALVVFAFKQYKVTKAEFRWWNSSESKTLENIFFTSPWIYIEAGMASALKKPMLVVSDYIIDDGVFIDNEDDDYIFLVNPNGDFQKDRFEHTYSEWSNKI